MRYLVRCDGVQVDLFMRGPLGAYDLPAAPVLPHAFMQTASPSCKRCACKAGCMQTVSYTNAAHANKGGKGGITWNLISNSIGFASACLVLKSASHFFSKGVPVSSVFTS